MTGILNAFSVDVEEYFQVSAFERVVSTASWDRFESRVERSTLRLLDLCDRHGVKATFFMLGWVAERHPSLLQEIHLRGHEVASHGYAHQMVDQSSPVAFREEVRSEKAFLEDAIGSPVYGYRAPSFSITRRTAWALEILAEEGYRYDSSIFPIWHDRYGMPDAYRFPYTVRCGDRVLCEFPLSTVRVFDAVNLPIAGGGYLRLLPLRLTRWGIRRVNQHEGQPVVVYVHPWEIDPEQPRIPAGGLARFRHYRNLDQAEHRVERLLEEFSWGTIRSVLQVSESAARKPVHSNGGSPIGERRAA